MINKNGIILTNTFYESDAMLMNKTKQLSYTPQDGKYNNCLTGEAITGFVEGKQYYIEFTLIWSGFKDKVESTFACWAQGSTYDGTSWNWNLTNPLTNSLPKFTPILLSSDSGEKLIQSTFTANARTGYYFGIRTDYSNGVGNITLSNIKVIPDEYASGSTPPIQNYILEKILWQQENLWSTKSSKGGDLV